MRHLVESFSNKFLVSSATCRGENKTRISKWGNHKLIMGINGEFPLYRWMGSYSYGSWSKMEMVNGWCARNLGITTLVNTLRGPVTILDCFYQTVNRKLINSLLWKPSYYLIANNDTYPDFKGQQEWKEQKDKFSFKEFRIVSDN